MKTLCSLLLLLSVTLANAQYQVVKYRNWVYTTGGGYPQSLDLYLPASSVVVPRKGIVFVHGGGWTGGDKADYDGMAKYYAAQGYVCTSINYRLAPQHIWPAQIDDVQAAVRWMRKMAPALHVNPNKIAAIGASAGGHLVQLLCLTDTLHNVDPYLKGYSSRVQLCFDFVGPSDFSNPPGWDPAIWQLVVQLLGMPYVPPATAYQQASPINWVDPGDSPMVLFYGIADPVVPIWQGRTMDQRLTTVGIPHQYYEFPNEGHGFTWPTFLFCIGIIDSTLTLL